MQAHIITPEGSGYYERSIGNYGLRNGRDFCRILTDYGRDIPPTVGRRTKVASKQIYIRNRNKKTDLQMLFYI